MFVFPVVRLGESERSQRLSAQGRPRSKHSRSLSGVQTHTMGSVQGAGHSRLKAGAGADGGERGDRWRWGGGE